MGVTVTICAAHSGIWGTPCHVSQPGWESARQQRCAAAASWLSSSCNPFCSASCAHSPPEDSAQTGGAHELYMLAALLAVAFAYSYKKTHDAPQRAKTCRSVCWHMNGFPEVLEQLSEAIWYYAGRPKTLDGWQCLSSCPSPSRRQTSEPTAPSGEYQGSSVAESCISAYPLP